MTPPRPMSPEAFTASALLAPQITDDSESQAGLIKIRLHHRVSRRPPILFVPGAFSGAWIWRGNFLEHFHQAGHDVAAMSFAGHGRRGWPLWRRGLRDFDDDLVTAISQFDTPPILIAHSLGGLIAQRVARRVSVTALALLSPVPIDGLARSVLSLARKSPVSVLKLASLAFEPRVSRLAAAPMGIYSAAVPEKARSAFTGRLQAESPVVLVQSLLHRPDTEGAPSCPIHFWGAEGDHIVPAREVERSARAMHAAFRIFPGMSHTFQAEPNWRELANDVLSWVNEVVQTSRTKAIRRGTAPKPGCGRSPLARWKPRGG
jgi:pimeloyl-ACP methyl ester carboxylesterase